MSPGTPSPGRRVTLKRRIAAMEPALVARPIEAPPGGLVLPDWRRLVAVAYPLDAPFMIRELRTTNRDPALIPGRCRTCDPLRDGTAVEGACTRLRNGDAPANARPVPPRPPRCTCEGHPRRARLPAALPRRHAHRAARHGRRPPRAPRLAEAESTGRHLPRTREKPPAPRRPRRDRVRGAQARRPRRRPMNSPTASVKAGVWGRPRDCCGSEDICKLRCKPGSVYSPTKVRPGATPTNETRWRRVPESNRCTRICKRLHARSQDEPDVVPVRLRQTPPVVRGHAGLHRRAARRPFRHEPR